MSLFSQETVIEHLFAHGCVAQREADLACIQKD